MKIKEKILKLGKRKNCFIALLMAILLAFAVLGGLNGSKSADIKADAFSNAPQEKTLDLNGVRYSYQTSLKELKNEYNIFKYQYDNNLFTLTTGESVTTIHLNSCTGDWNNSLYLDASEILKTIFEFKFNYISYDYTISADNSGTTPVPSFDFDNIDSLDGLTNLKINFNNFINLPNYYAEVYSGRSINILFYFLKDGFSPTETENLDYIYNNSIILGYAFSNSIDFQFTFPDYEGYRLTNITCSVSSETIVDDNDYNKNSIYVETLSEVITPNSLNNFNSALITIENLNIIDNKNSNVVSYNISHATNDTQYTIYQGDLLLSKTNYDVDFIKALLQNKGFATVNTSGGAVFGGKQASNIMQGQIDYYVERVGTFDSWYNAVNVYRNNDVHGHQNALQMEFSGDLYGEIPTTPKYNIFKQAQILYLNDAHNLRSTYNNQDYAALSAQVEDVLYGLQYVGDVEQIEQDEKIQEDLENLLKLTGLGAVIGLIVGILFGNPLLGLIVGALFGFFVALFPLLIDGLQQIFGPNSLQGPYNFFKSITNFFGNIVDTIVNFLMKIITNPFILILIVIIAIIYIIKRYGNK